MTRRTTNRQFAVWLGAMFGVVCSLFAFTLAAQASDRAFTEEFHQTYNLTPNGRVELDNINGPVHISTWDQNEIKVDAVKYAGTKERLDEARIEVDSGKDYLSVRTKYPDHDQIIPSSALRSCFRGISPPASRHKPAYKKESESQGREFRGRPVAS